VYSPIWRALTREAAIAGQSISAGLGSLRSANYAATGLYSHAFFSLSIGFERFLKLIFLIDFALKNQSAFPTDNDLRKKFGHDLEKLFAYAITVHERLRKKRSHFPLRSGGLEHEIIHFLSAFATRTRYYNLDFLVGAQAIISSNDPVAEWYETIGQKILVKHYTNRQQQKDLREAAIIEAMVAGSAGAIVLHTAEDGSPITSLAAGALQTGKNKVLQKYGTFYCAKIARFLYMVMYELVHEAHTAGLGIPYLYELFFPFMNDDAYLLSRKTFPPQGQGR